MDQVTNDQFLQFLIQSLGGLKGAGAMAIGAIIVQVLIMFLKTPFVDQIFHSFATPMKLLVIMGLSVVSGIISLMISGLSLPAALMHSTTLGLAMAFVNQLITYYEQKNSVSASVAKP
jgi:hypothetical protein